MTLARFKGQNHPQQLAKRGALADVDDRGTTAELFDPLNERFRFSIDVAAAAHNTKCPRFFTVDDDGLTQSWAGERVWCNPPYSNLGAWVAKAWTEWRSDRPPHVIVMLVPANRTEQAWWQDHVEPFRDRPGPVLAVPARRALDRRVPSWPPAVHPPRPHRGAPEPAAPVRRRSADLARPRPRASRRSTPVTPEPLAPWQHQARIDGCRCWAASAPCEVHQAWADGFAAGLLEGHDAGYRDAELDAEDIDL